MLTLKQQKQVEELVPHARRIAKTFQRGKRDDQYETEAMVALCEAVLSYDPARCSRLDRWVDEVVRSRLIDYRRKQGQPWRDTQPLTAGCESRPRVPVHELIEQLPEDVRDVVRARFVERMKPTAVARYYGLSMQEVREKLARGRDELQRLIDDQP